MRGKVAGTLVAALVVVATWVTVGSAQTAAAPHAVGVVTETFVDKKEKTLAVKWDDELVKATMLTRDGAVVHPSFAPKNAA